MKLKFILAICLFILSFNTQAQYVSASTIQAINNLVLAGKKVNGISNDTTMIQDDSVKLATQYAIKSYVDNHIHPYSGSTYHLPYNGDSTKYLGGDTVYHALPTSGTASRFGIEDNIGVQDRDVDLQDKNLTITSGDRGYSTPLSKLQFYPDNVYITSSETDQNLYSSVETDAFDGYIPAVILTANNNNLFTTARFRRLTVEPNSVYITYPDSTATHEVKREIPTSVNGNFADSTGNITISAGGGGSYHLPYNGDSTKYLGGDTVYHPLPTSGTASRFGIEDNTGVQDRVVNHGGFNMFETFGDAVDYVNPEFEQTKNAGGIVNYAQDLNSVNYADHTFSPTSILFRHTEPDFTADMQINSIGGGASLNSNGSGANAGYSSTISTSLGILLSNTDPFGTRQVIMDGRELIIRQLNSVGGHYGDIVFPKPNTNVISPLSINGTFADSTGNITISTGGGSYHLPYNGDSTNYLGGDTAYHALPLSRFGIEDSTGVQNRFINMYSHDLDVNNGGVVSLSAGDGDNSFVYSSLYADVIGHGVGIYASDTTYGNGSATNLINISSTQALPSFLDLSHHDKYGDGEFKVNNSGFSFLITKYYDNNAGQTDPTITRSNTISFPAPTVNAAYIIPLSVNGNFADSTGNITIATGGGSSSYHLPYNGDSTKYLGGDTAYHALPLSRFGIEDNIGVQDRKVRFYDKNFYLGFGDDSTLATQNSNLFIDSTGFLLSESSGSGNQASFLNINNGFTQSSNTLNYGGNSKGVSDYYLTDFYFKAENSYYDAGNNYLYNNLQLQPQNTYIRSSYNDASSSSNNIYATVSTLSSGTDGGNINASVNIYTTKGTTSTHVTDLLLDTTGLHYSRFDKGSGATYHINTPSITSNSTFTFPLSVNGNFADLTGNITISGGGGGSYHLPYNGDSTKYLGGDTVYHSLPTSGTTSRFGIEDNRGIQDRKIRDGIYDFYHTVGDDSSYSNYEAEYHLSPTNGFSAYAQDNGFLHDVNLHVFPLAITLGYSDEVNAIINTLGVDSVGAYLNSNYAGNQATIKSDSAKAIILYHNSTTGDGRINFPFFTGNVNKYSLLSVNGVLADMNGNVNTRLKSYTVATLPSSPTQGDEAAVTDATSPTYLGALTGGGSTYTPVIFNGTIWVSH